MMQGNQGSRLKDSLTRRLSEQQQAALYSNYSLLLLAAGRLDAARDIVNTYEKRCTTLPSIPCFHVYRRCAGLQKIFISYRKPESVIISYLLCRYPDSEELQMAAAAVLAREAKQQEALTLVANARSRNGALLRAQLALEAGDTSQVSYAVTGVLANAV